MVVPWFGAASITKSSTSAWTDGQYLIAQRGISPPWLWPTMSTFRPVIRWMASTAKATYSADTWRSPSPRSG